MRRVIVTGLFVASAVVSSSSYAAMDKPAHDAFVARCQTSMYMPKAQCICMADLAAKKLDDLSIAYLSQDPLDVRTSAEMSKKMTGHELSSIDNFMKTAPHACVGAK